MSREKSARLVYTTDTGRHCPNCQKAIAVCACRTLTQIASTDFAAVRRESKGRGGKTVTVISGLALPEDALSTLASLLKKQAGTGGTLKNGIIEIQGDQVESVLATLTERGIKVKKIGG